MTSDALQKNVVQDLVKQGIFVNGETLDRIKMFSEDQLEVVRARIGDGEKDVDKLFAPPKESTGIEVLFNYQKEFHHKKSVNDFVQYMHHRHKAISKILKARPELSRTLSISRILSKKDSEKVAFTGLVTDKAETKNGHMMLTIEDPTAKIRVLINKDKKELIDQCKDLVFDEVIGITGTNKEEIVFGDEVIWPDVPLHKELKKCPDDVYAIFISDLHVGSIDFLPEKFDKFLSWLNGDIETAHGDMISKVKYLYIMGDIIEGIGIYPGQEKELTHMSAKEQYKEAARFIAKIPKRIQVVVCSGNHDAMRLAEPQPPISKELAPDLYEIENVTVVSNPARIKMHKTETFPGFDVLMYHGYSFDYYVSNVDSIRNQGGYHRADLLMKFLLKRRHVAPSHTSVPYIPDRDEDPLVIKTVPDFFVTGHIHYTAVANYNNVTLICGSCWQKATSFQMKVGHDPEPGRVPIVHLKTRKVKILKF